MNRDLKICLIPLFLYVMILVCVMYIPQVTFIDIKLIRLTQKIFAFIPANVSDFISTFFYHYFKIFMLLTCGFLIYKKDYFLTVWYLILVFYNKYITLFMKNIVQRPRPPFELQPLSHPETFSFHSGHSFSIMILLGIFVYVICKYVKNKTLKIILNTISIIWITLVGLSRIMLGVHYPSDVIAGYILGIFFICILVKTDMIRSKKNDN